MLRLVGFGPVIPTPYSTESLGSATSFQEFLGCHYDHHAIIKLPNFLVECLLLRFHIYEVPGSITVPVAGCPELFCDVSLPYTYAEIDLRLR
jgi:hypothetical protein